MDAKVILNRLVSDRITRIISRNKIGDSTTTKVITEIKIIPGKGTLIRITISTDTLEIGLAREMEMGSDNRTQTIITDNLISRLAITTKIGIDIKIIRDNQTQGTIKDSDLTMATKTEGIISMERETKETTQDKT